MADTYYDHESEFVGARELRASYLAFINEIDNVSWAEEVYPLTLLNTPEDRKLRKTLKEFQKYIEPLRCTIAAMPPTDITTIGRFTSLLNHLTYASKSLPYENLITYKPLLDKILSRFKRAQLKPQHPLQTVVETVVQSDIMNHTLKRTFKAALQLSTGTDNSTIPPKLPVGYEEDTPELIPHILKGEIARLDQQFRVSLDTTRNDNKTIGLICYLDDKRLPCVPPISVNIPENYPFTSPECLITPEDYSATTFLVQLQAILWYKIAKLPKCFSLTHFLNTWQMSVHLASSRKAIILNDLASIFGV